MTADLGESNGAMAGKADELVGQHWCIGTERVKGCLEYFTEDVKGED